jgi:hypothetical protein
MSAPRHLHSFYLKSTVPGKDVACIPITPILAELNKMDGALAGETGRR